MDGISYNKNSILQNFDETPEAGSKHPVTSEGIKEFVDKSYTIAGQKEGTTLGTKATAEGIDTTASAQYSHAEGENTEASGESSHTEGKSTIASSFYSHAEGLSTKSTGVSSHSEGNSTEATESNAHAEGSGTKATGVSAHSEGTGTQASGVSAHSEGNASIAQGDVSHAEGFHTTATGDYSHSEGNFTEASGLESHAEGGYTKAIGDDSHAEGVSSQSVGMGSHAEGGSRAAGTYSHSEGSGTTAQGEASHAEGAGSFAIGEASHSEGKQTSAHGAASHAEGTGTVAQNLNQHVFGSYNILDPSGNAITDRGTYVEIVGNGPDLENKSNARTLDWSGNEELAGKLTIGAEPTANMDVTTKGYVDNADGVLDAKIEVVKTQLTQQFNFKGSVASLSALPSSGNTQNDTYYVTSEYCLYSWNGTSWEKSSMDETSYLSMIDTLREDMAATYDATETYKVGDAVIHDNQLYVCKTAITVAEAWNAAHWEPVNFATGISNIILVQDTQPTTSSNKIWLQQTEVDGVEVPEVEDIENIIAASYDATATYEVGEYCLYNMLLYRCTTEITTAEAWTSEHWTQVSVSGEIDSVKSALNAANKSLLYNASSDGTWKNNYYVNNNNEIVTSSSWESRYYKVSELPLNFDAILYGNTGSFKAIAFYSDVPADAYYLDGVRFDSGTLVETNRRKFENITIPSNATYVLISNRSVSGSMIVEGLLDTVYDAISSNKKLLRSIFNGKKISIIGDSVETFDDSWCKISGYSMYYPRDDVNSVDKTWWKQVIDNSGATLEINASYSYSRVTNTSQGTPDFYDRVNLIGSPDVIFVALGSADSSVDVALGDYDYTTQYAELSESTFRTAYIKGIKAIKALHPNAQIVCVILKMQNTYKESIVNICNTLNCVFIDASDYVSASGVNPGSFGMLQIASQVLYPTDKTLSQEKIPADAKKTGDIVEQINNNIFEVYGVNDATKVFPGYIDSDGIYHQSGTNWRTYVYDADYVNKILRAEAYISTSNIRVVGYYSKHIEVSADMVAANLISVEPLSLGSARINTYIDLTPPVGCKAIAISNNITTLPEPTIAIQSNALKKEIHQLDEKISNIVGTKSNVATIYKDIWNSNDFVFVGDELWLAKNDTTLANCEIRRYKIDNDMLVYQSTLLTDFGHFNVADYCAENDCLIFGNGANDEGTTGNWFAVVRHPLTLSGTVSLDDVGIKYQVDIGFKVQALWGDANFGEYNKVCLLSNNSQTITEVLLQKDNNGEFDGNYITLRTRQRSEAIGVGGADFWNNALYIGDGVRYGYHKVSMTDLSDEPVITPFYQNDGTPISGSTQGIFIDKDFLWVFYNIGGSSTNYLVQYYR